MLLVSPLEWKWMSCKNTIECARFMFHKGESVHRASRDTVLAMCAAGFIDDCKKPLQNQGIYRAKGNTGCTPKAAIFIHDEF